MCPNVEGVSGTLDDEIAAEEGRDWNDGEGKGA